MTDKDSSMGYLVIDLYNEGLVGFVEGRSWLARLYEDFAQVRDLDLEKKRIESENEQLKLFEDE